MNDDYDVHDEDDNNYDKNCISYNIIIDRFIILEYHYIYYIDYKKVY